MRSEWGYRLKKHLTKEDLSQEKYRSIRPAAGYPACPDHTDKAILWELSHSKKNAGIQLTESFAMLPGALVSGLYFARPEAKYFGVGKINRDQVLDYQVRKRDAVRRAETLVRTEPELSAGEVTGWRLMVNGSRLAVNGWPLASVPR